MIGTVQKVSEQEAWVSYAMGSSCGSCTKCGGSNRIAKIDIAPDSSLSQGSSVEIGLTSGQIVISLFFAFGLPTILAFLTLFSVLGMGGGDTLAAFLSLAAVALGWLITSRVSKKYSHWFQPRLIKGECPHV